MKLSVAARMDDAAPSYAADHADIGAVYLRKNVRDEILGQAKSVRHFRRLSDQLEIQPMVFHIKHVGIRQNGARGGAGILQRPDSGSV